MMMIKKRNKKIMLMAFEGKKIKAHPMRFENRRARSRSPPGFWAVLKKSHDYQKKDASPSI
jgi:hypothetical protein